MEKKEMMIEAATTDEVGNRNDEEKSQFYVCLFSYVDKERGVFYQRENTRYHLWREFTLDWHKLVDSNNKLSSNSSSDSDDSDYSEAYVWIQGHLALTDWPKMPLTASICGSAVSVGSVIYLVGGEHCLPGMNRLSQKVFKLDTLQSSSGWQEVHCLSSGRLRPAVYHVDGKIYVFGGTPLPFGEVYDTKADKWTDLPQPADEISSSSDLNVFNSGVFSDSDGRNTHLLIYPYDSEKLYAYHLDGERWTVIDAEFGKWEGKMFVVGNTLFVSDDNFLLPYDLVKKKWLRPVVPEPHEWLFSSSGNMWEDFINMGNGKFCYMTKAFNSSIHLGTRLVLVCTKFAVSKHPNPNYVADDEDVDQFTITLSHEGTTYYRLDEYEIMIPEYFIAI